MTQEDEVRKEMENQAQNGWRQRLPSSESFKNVAQGVALLAAATAALLAVWFSDRPTLEARAETGSNLTWYQSANDQEFCIVQFWAKIENIGRSLLSVDSVRLRAWEYDRKLQPGSDLSFIDREMIMETDPIFTREADEGAFILEYPPGTAYNWIYEFAVKNNPTRTMLVQIDFEGEADTLLGKKPFSVGASSFDDVCNLSGDENTPQGFQQSDEQDIQ